MCRPARQESFTASCSPKIRTAERTRKEKLDFLDKKPSFRPKIIHQAPDFSRLHKALQTEALRKTQTKEVTKCQPFYLRTSALPARQSRMSPEITGVKHLHILTCFLYFVQLFHCFFLLFFLVAFSLYHAARCNYICVTSVNMKDSVCGHETVFLLELHIQAQMGSRSQLQKFSV